jgi:hypothetical protein
LENTSIASSYMGVHSFGAGAESVSASICCLCSNCTAISVVCQDTSCIGVTNLGTGTGGGVGNPTQYAATLVGCPKPHPCPNYYTCPQATCNSSSIYN